MHRSPNIMMAAAWLWVALVSAPGWADVQLNTTRIWRRAQVIPSGQQVWDFASSYQNYSDKFSGEGVVQPMGASLSRSVTWRDLIKSKATAPTDLRTFMSAHALDESAPLATSTYDVNVQEVSFGVNWAYGLTNTWMIGLQIPVVLRNTRVQEHFQVRPELSQGASGQGVQALLSRTLAGRLHQLSQAQLQSAGYDMIPEQRQTVDLSDVSLLSQVAVLDTYRWQWSVQQLVRLPTAQTPNTADYVQTSHDEGPVDLGLSSVLDYRRRRWIFGGRVGYVAQLPDQTRVRVPVDDNGTNSRVDPRVGRQLGDYVWTAVDTEYQLTSDLTVDAEYSFLHKNQDHYSSGTLPGVDYASLEQGTEEQLHQARVGLFYRLGTEALNHGIKTKWVVAVDYQMPLIGRNAADAARSSLELINYF